MPSRDGERVIALSIVTLAERLGLSCVGVGVDTTEQLDCLPYHGRDKAGGSFHQEATWRQG